MGSRMNYDLYPKLCMLAAGLEWTGLEQQPFYIKRSLRTGPNRILIDVYCIV